MNKQAPYSGPFPRKRHSHCCKFCLANRGQGAVACYKSQCSKPQRVDSCDCCRIDRRQVPAAAPAPGPRPEVQEVAQWYTLIDEKRRQVIFSALSESQRKQAFQYGLAVSWNMLPQYARDLVTTEWWGNNRPAAAPAPVDNSVEFKTHRPECGFLKFGVDQTPCNCAQLAAAEFFAAPAAAPAPAEDPWSLLRRRAQLSLF